MIGVIGLNHKSAPVEVREKFAVNAEESIDLSKEIMSNQYLDEVVVLSTCNRTEVYFNANECCSSGAFSMVMKHLKHFARGTGYVSDEHFYRYRHDEAVRHLFRVVSGLDSMILGEYQIVSQIKEAFQLAREYKTVGKIFKRLFNKALETGKLVRSQTEMSEGAFSVSYAAVRKCQEQFGHLGERKILLIGAGETGELVVKNLRKKGCSHISITNRTEEHARVLAERYQGNVVPFSSLMQGIHDAEIVVSSVSSKKPLFDAEKLRPHLNGHPNVLMIDLGIPRNIHPDVSGIPGVSLLYIDELEGVMAESREKKQAQVANAESIIGEKVTEFSDWMNTRNLSPVIQNIIAAIEQLGIKELTAIKNSCQPENYPLLEKQHKRMSEKLVRLMVKNLKTISNNGRETEYIKVVNDLFSVPDETNMSCTKHKS